MVIAIHLLYSFSIWFFNTQGTYFRCSPGCVTVETIELIDNGEVLGSLRTERYHSKKNPVGHWEESLDTITLVITKKNKPYTARYVLRSHDSFQFLVGIGETAHWKQACTAIDSLVNHDEELEIISRGSPHEKMQELEHKRKNELAASVLFDQGRMVDIYIRE